MAASVANQAATTGVAVGAVVLCLVQLIYLKRDTDRVSQVEVLGLADEIQSGLECLLSLLLLAAQAVVATVFYEVGTYFDKGERHICLVAFMVKGQHPIIITGTGASIVFPATDDLLDKTFLQIRKKADRADKGSTHDSFVSEGKFFQIWQPLIGHRLILAGHVEPDIFPTLPKIIGEAFCHPFRSFGQQVEYDIGPPMHYVPGFSTPLVSLWQKEVRGHAYTNQFAGPDFVVAVTVFLQGIVEIVGSINVSPGFSSLLVEGVHVAVGTAGADADAAMPWIPDIVHTSHLRHRNSAGAGSQYRMIGLPQCSHSYQT